MQFCMSRYISPHLLALLGHFSSQALFSYRHDYHARITYEESSDKTAGESGLPPTSGESAVSFLHSAVGRTRLPATTPDELYATPVDAFPSYVSSVDCCFCLSRIGCWPSTAWTSYRRTCPSAHPKMHHSLCVVHGIKRDRTPRMTCHSCDPAS